MERVAVVSLLTTDGQLPTAGEIAGALGIEVRTGKMIVFDVPSVILTSGQIGAKIRSHFINNMTGDGQAMAARAGAELMNMEFCITGNISYFMRRYHSGSQSLLQALGARFVNANGEHFMDKYDHVLGDRSKRSTLVQAFTKECLEGRGPVYYDMTMFSEEDVAMVRSLLPTTWRPFDEAGINVRKQLIDCAPVLSVASTSGDGGIRVDKQCSTNLPGLFAAGAAAWNPVHGTYTVGGINLAFCNVAGCRAGLNAAIRARGIQRPTIDQAQVSQMVQNILSV